MHGSHKTINRIEVIMNLIPKPKMLPPSVLPPLPEVYQIETVSTCNYSCIMCPTQFFERKDKTPFIDVELVKKIVNQGDLDGSHFVEFQMSGEPLLHPHLSEIISIVKTTGVMTGLSTNGSLIRPQIEALKKLAYITVSVDSLTHYSEIRKGKNAESSANELVNNIWFLLSEIDFSKTTIDLQILELTDWENDIDRLKELFKKFPEVNYRTAPNCFVPYFYPEDYELPASKELCINPWFSCSIQSNGNVASCCFSFGDDVQYGNVKNNTLREIWAGEEVIKLRREHESKNYRSLCNKCHVRSPALFHWELYNSSIKKRYRGVKCL
jgi:radical SAM protein with 4Fe4S-binding SPASM domain